jgi:hypothetical protein
VPVTFSHLVGGLLALILRLVRPDLGLKPKLVVCNENSDSDVLMMQSADHGVRRDASDLLNRAGDRRIVVQ